LSQTYHTDCLYNLQIDFVVYLKLLVPILENIP